MDINNIQVKGRNILVPFESGFATGLMEGPPVLEREPVARPKFKIPYTLWRESLAFLADVFHIKGWEAQLLWFRNESTGEWKTYCPVQTGSGATTNTIDCDDNDNALNFLANSGFECVGSIHSHCNMAAFQSGTDKDDEVGQTDGFHVTIGKMKEDIFDIHCRSIITIMGDVEKKTKAERRQVQFFIEDFVDGIPDYNSAPFPIPSRIRKQLVTYYLLNQEDLECEYDEAWAERVIDKPKEYPKPWNGTTWVNGIEYKVVDGKVCSPVHSPSYETPVYVNGIDHKRLREWEEELEEDRLEQEAKVRAQALMARYRDDEDDETQAMIDQQGRLYGIG
jgi:hypothetical protein